MEFVAFVELIRRTNQHFDLGISTHENMTRFVKRLFYVLNFDVFHSFIKSEAFPDVQTFLREALRFHLSEGALYLSEVILTQRSKEQIQLLLLVSFTLLCFLFDMSFQ